MTRLEKIVVTLLGILSIVVLVMLVNQNVSSATILESVSRHRVGAIR